MEARDLLGLERPESAPAGQEAEEMRDEAPSELASLLTMSSPLLYLDDARAKT